MFEEDDCCTYCRRWRHNYKRVNGDQWACSAECERALIAGNDIPDIGQLFEVIPDVCRDFECAGGE